MLARVAAKPEETLSALLNGSKKDDFSNESLRQMELYSKMVCPIILSSPELFERLANDESAKRDTQNLCIISEWLIKNGKHKKYGSYRFY